MKKVIINDEQYFILKERLEKLDRQQPTGYVPILYPGINSKQEKDNK